MTTAAVQADTGGLIAVDAKGAARLMSVSPRTWRRWTAGGLTPSPIRVGGAVRWRTDELVAWAAAGCPTRARWAETAGSGVGI